MFIKTQECVWKVLLALLIFISLPFEGFTAWGLPPHNFGVSEQGSSKIVSDNIGHAITLIADDEVGASVYYYTMGAWTATPTYTLMADFLDIDIAMEDSGTALLVWNSVGVGYTSYFDGSIWSNIPLSPFGNLVSISVAMNGPNSGVAAWSDGTNVYSSFFVNGAWGLATNIGVGDSDVNVAYGINGSVVAGWNNGLAAIVSEYVAGSWLMTTTLDPDGFIIAVGIDASGNGLALYLDSCAYLFAAYFNGSVWDSPVSISSNPTINVSLSMGSGGVAVAVWRDNFSNTGYTSTFNEGVWSVPYEFTTEILVNNNPAASVNSEGNVLIVYATTSSDVKSIRKTLTGDWNPEELLQQSDFTAIFSVGASLSANNIGYAAWNFSFIDFTDKYTFAAVTTPPNPANDFAGQSFKNKFVTQCSLYTILFWGASDTEGVVSYKLRKNGILIATIGVDEPYTYLDQHRCKIMDIVYTLTAVDAVGSQSVPVTVIIN